MEKRSGLMEHQADEGHIVETDEGGLESLVVTGQPPEASHPGKASLYHPSTRQQHKPSLCLWQSHHFQLDALFLRCLGWLLPGVSLIYERYLDALSRFLLHCLGKLCYLGSLLFVGRSRVHSQQMSQSIHCHMHLRALPLLVPVVSGSLSTLWCRLQRSRVQDYGSRFSLSALGKPQHLSKIVDYSLEAAGLYPTLSLLIDGVPGRQVVSHHPPRRSRPYYPPQTIEHFPQRVFPLWSFLGHQCQVRRDEAPLLVANITRVWLSCLHTIILPT